MLVLSVFLFFCVSCVFLFQNPGALKKVVRWWLLFSGLVKKVVRKRLAKAWVAEALAAGRRAVAVAFTVAVAVFEREQRQAQQFLVTSGVRMLFFFFFELQPPLNLFGLLC